MIKIEKELYIQKSSVYLFIMQIGTELVLKYDVYVDINMGGTLEEYR